MTPPTLEPLQIPVGTGWLSGGYSAPKSPRATLLIVPPFFHEWQRGYRLFALLANALARRDVAVLRFDYRGCGDSSGPDTDFLPSRALEDTEAALVWLRGRVEAPLTLLGIRAGALLAERIAERHGMPWWAWQPVEDGGAYLGQLRQRTETERNSRQRYPFRMGRDAKAHGELMGHRIHPEFEIELPILRRTGRPQLRIDTPEACGDGVALVEDSLHVWTGQIDLQAPPPIRVIQTLAETLSDRLFATNGAAA